MTSAPRWRVVIVDDEPPARRSLELLLSTHTDFVVSASCAHGADAVAAVRAHAPDLLFLDVQMPGMDGLSVIAELGADTVPAIVFVTAYEHYALRAFETHALDYLLKPFTDERFFAVLDRVRIRLRERRHVTHVDTASLTVRDGSRTVVIPARDIVWIEAEDYYVRVHTAARRVLVRRSLRALTAHLDPDTFVRVHRSAIVNVRSVREVTPLASGDQQLSLADGTTLRVSRTYRAALEARLK
jgi:two-component system LytT family response regulator